MRPEILHALIWLPVAALVAVLMDFWAGLLHGRIWHSWLWPVHKSHHVPRVGRFEQNDALAFFHAPIAVALILYGCAGPSGALRELLFGVGIGMTLFAVGYIVVHDGLVHERLPVRFLMRFRWLRRVVAAHRVHHNVYPGRAPYGLFFGPAELRRHIRATRPKSASTNAPHQTPNAPHA